MRLLSTIYPISVVALLAAFVPGGLAAAEMPAPGAPVNVTVAIDRESVRVSGTVAGARPLQAVLYATFAPDLPIVLLSRRPLASDAGGHFNAVLPIAPAYFSGATITVLVQTASAATVGRGSATIPEPLDVTPTRI